MRACRASRARPRCVCNYLERRARPPFYDRLINFPGLGRGVSVSLGAWGISLSRRHSRMATYWNALRNRTSKRNVLRTREKELMIRLVRGSGSILIQSRGLHRYYGVQKTGRRQCLGVLFVHGSLCARPHRRVRCKHTCAKRAYASNLFEACSAADTSVGHLIVDPRSQ